jgi:hypothetical protein
MTIIPPNQDRALTLDDIKTTMSEYFVMKDEGVLELNTCCAIVNRMPGIQNPVWLLNVAESSGGKTEIIDLFSKLQEDKYKLAYYISDLTPQTFISGMQNNSKQTSLLYKLNGRTVFFKDFTTILQKNQEARKEILSQLREIYDGGYNKDFGTGQSVHWKGRIGVIAGLTPPAFEMLSQFSGMGERFIAYFMKQPTDAELAQILKSNFNKDIKEIKDRASTQMAEYVYRMVMLAEENPQLAMLPDEIIDELNEVAQFATRARSHVPYDFRTYEPIGMPSIERFPRFAISLQSLGKGYCLMNHRPDITQLQRNTLYKIALDSIPRLRRVLLQILAGNRTVSTSAVATKIGFTTAITRGHLTQLSALSLVIRIPNGGKGNEDAWRLNSYAKDFMGKFEHIKMEEKDLLDEDDVEPLNTLQNTGIPAEKLKLEAEQARDHAEIAKIHSQNQEIGVAMTWGEAEAIYNKAKAEGMYKNDDDF